MKNAVEPMKNDEGAAIKVKQRANYSLSSREPRIFFCCERKLEASAVNSFAAEPTSVCGFTADGGGRQGQCASCARAQRALCNDDGWPVAASWIPGGIGATHRGVWYCFRIFEGGIFDSGKACHPNASQCSSCVRFTEDMAERSAGMMIVGSPASCSKPVEGMTNDWGHPVKLGNQEYGTNDEDDGSSTFYCGRTYPMKAVPGRVLPHLSQSDGQCGPDGGGQCASCARFQQMLRNDEGWPVATGQGVDMHTLYCGRSFSVAGNLRHCGHPLPTGDRPQCASCARAEANLLRVSPATENLEPGVMEQRLDVLLDRIVADATLRACAFARNDIVAVLKEHNGHMGKALNQLKKHAEKQEAEKRTEEEIMEKRIDSLMARVAADGVLRQCHFPRADVAACLKEQGGSLTKALKQLQAKAAAQASKQARYADRVARARGAAKVRHGGSKLSDADFERRLGCSRQEYMAMPPWKQRELAGLAAVPSPAVAQICAQSSARGKTLAKALSVDRLVSPSVQPAHETRPPSPPTPLLTEPPPATSSNPFALFLFALLEDDAIGHVLVGNLHTKHSRGAFVKHEAFDSVAVRALSECSKRLHAALKPELALLRLLRRLRVRSPAALAQRHEIMWQAQGVTDDELALWTGWLSRAAEGGGRTDVGDAVASLEILDLNHNLIGDRGVCELAGCAALARVRDLMLARNRISNLGMCVIAEAIRRGTGAFASLQTLNVRGQQQAAGGGSEEDRAYEAELMEACRENSCYWPDGLDELRRVCAARKCYLVCEGQVSSW